MYEHNRTSNELGGDPTLRQSTCKHSVNFCKCKYSVHVRIITAIQQSTAVLVIYRLCTKISVPVHDNRVKLHEVVYRNSPKLCHVLKISVSDITIGFNKYKHVYIYYKIIKQTIIIHIWQMYNLHDRNKIEV